MAGASPASPPSWGFSFLASAILVRESESPEFMCALGRLAVVGTDSRLRGEVGKVGPPVGTRARIVWDRIEEWFRVNVDADVANLGPPATEQAFVEVSEATGLVLPRDAREVYLIHNGDGSPPGLFGNWEQFYSLAAAIETWGVYQHLLRSMPEAPRANGDWREHIQEWRKQIAEGMVFVRGPVKPYIASPARLPITSMNGDVVRFLDFDPAPGGREGQVIEVDNESSIYQVVAPSLLDLLGSHADELEGGELTFEDGDLIRLNEPEIDLSGWGTPDFMR